MKRGYKLSKIFPILPNELLGNVIIARRDRTRPHLLRVRLACVKTPSARLLERLFVLGLEPKFIKSYLSVVLPAPVGIDENADIDIT